MTIDQKLRLKKRCVNTRKKSRMTRTRFPLLIGNHNKPELKRKLTLIKVMILQLITEASNACRLIAKSYREFPQQEEHLCLRHINGYK